MSCALKFVYDAAMQTPDVVVPNGSTVHYNPAPLGRLRGVCWLCGCNTESGHPRKKIIKPTFTDSNLARAPWSDVVCEHCAWALSYRSLRNYSIFATRNELQHPGRAEIHDILLSPLMPPFVLCVAESGQRWLHIRAQVSEFHGVVHVQFEDLPVLVKPEDFARILWPIEQLYKKFTKEEIMTGNYKSHKIQEFGLGIWMDMESIIAPWRKSSMFKLAMFVAQREEETRG